MFDPFNQTTSPSVPPVSSEPASWGDLDRFPLSFAQQRLWFLDRLIPGEPLYNIPGGVRLSGALDVHLLAWSLSAIVDRHEVLRTAFIELEGEPLQVPLPELDLPLPVVDLSSLSPAEREEEVRRRAAEHARTSFDLGQPPLLRTSLLRLGEREHLLLVVIHHIVADGWSMGVLVRELTELYQAAYFRTASALEELPVQYADYAAWQREWLQGEELEARLEYWRGRLGGRLPTLQLPTFRPRPAEPSTQGGQWFWTVDSGVAAELAALGRRQGATLFMTLLAAFLTLLNRVTGEEDLVVGTPVAGRLRPEVEGLIGCFVNTLVLRNDLSGDPSFREVLERVSQRTFEALEHEELPFEKLVEELQPDRELGRTPLFQVMFSMQTAELPRLSLPGLEIQLEAADAGTAKFDLSLEMSSSGAILGGAFEFAADLYDTPTIARLQAGFDRLLAAVAASPGRPVADLSLLSPEESFQVIAEWNDTAEAWSGEGSVHGRISAQARRTPEELAVVTEAGNLTYGELEERAESLAGYLRSIGVGPEVLVGVALGDMLDLLVSLLAIWKAGGAYVPLDLAYPPDRLAYLVEDSRCALVITRGEEPAWLSATSAAAGARLIQLGRDVDPAAAGGGGAAGAAGVEETDPASLAYVIYTSGSTGRPKGVLATQGGLLNYCMAARRSYGLRPGDRLLQFVSPSFDVFLDETMPTWLAGATIVAGPDRVHYSFQELVAFIREHRVTVADLPSSYWHGFVSELQAGTVTLPESLRLIVLGSEAVSPAKLAVWQALVGERIAIVNVYGPTECTIADTHFSPPFAAAYPGPVLPVGRPLANVRVHLVDGRLRPVGIGIPGELCIGGDGVTRGYLGRPDLTAERFIPDPFAAGPGARLYRTGDLARFLPDGVLDFLGRIDQQVKVRGYRIELGEVEVAVQDHPAIQEAVVVVAGEQLVAYVVLRPGAADGALQAVGQSLREKLPPHMVPSAFVPLDRLPRTPNDKIDRKLLAGMPVERPAAEGRELLAPRNEAERALAALWSEVLGVEQVAADANFFALGGHSLLVAKLLSRVRERLGVELPLRSVFETPVLADMAARIASQLPAGPGAPPPLARSPRTAPPPLSFAQQRLWLLDRLEPGGSAYNVPDALRVTGRLRPEIWDRALSEVVRRHEALRTTFSMGVGEPVQVIAAPATVTSRRVDLSSLAPEEREAEARRLAVEEARAPFDLENGPLLRSTLVRLAGEDWLLLLTMHHIVSDGWSAGVLIHEMREIYSAFAEGLPSPLPELPVQYADFAVWQRGWLRGEVLEGEIAHWRGVLAGMPPALDLPTDHPRPAVKSFRGGHERLEIGAEVSRALADLASREGVTLFMAVLAAFDVLLSRYSNSRDFSVGSPISGRNHLEIEGLIGFFVNTLVLRADLSGDPDFLELLARVKARVLDAYSHQDVPFELLVDDLAPQRDLSRSPLFQVLLVLQNLSFPELELPGMTLAPVSVESYAAKFDLTLSVSEFEGRLYAGLQYAADLFEPPTARRMLRHFATLLEGIAGDPRRPVETLPLLAASERHQIALAWNDTSRGVVEETLHGLFAAQARRAPEAPALRFEGLEMTFGELDRRSNQLARFLGDHGVGPDVLVGLCMERSLELMVGVLGILKAGGGYVPLDPGYPAERLAYMMEDSRAPVMLGQERLLDRMPESEAFRVLVDADWDRVSGYSDAPLPELAETDNLACVLYTSGSTGRPKGVMDSHRCVINQLRWLQSTYRLDGTDRVLQKTPISWDVSQWELFWPLMSGACMVLAVPGGHQDPRYLASTISREKITTVHFVPSMLRIFLESESGESCASLRRVVSSGEALGLDLEEKFFASFTVDLNNMYGPGESARTTLWRCERENTKAIAPIGRPTHDTQVYILDRRMEPVPIGVTGEIWVASQSMARGYHLRPDLTAEKFLPNPFGAFGTRLYRTGDLGRNLPDGTLEFLGRIDHQVKIRGVRIELGEIETALGQHPRVSDAVVMARAASSGEKRLAAYVVPEGGPDSPDAVTVEELRAHLLAELPAYMVPESWTMLEAMPLAPNGKADRDRLPEPQWVTWQRDYVAPRTPVEDLLATVWSELLDVERVGGQDNFFELGGNSLVATQVASRVRAVFAVEMPLRAVFERPTLTELASVVEQLLRRGHASAAPPLLPAERTGPLSFAQQRLWFLERLQPGGSAYNIPNALWVKGGFRPELWDGALSEIVRRHESLRTTFALRDGDPFQVISPPAPVVSAVRDLRLLAPEARRAEARRLGLQEAERPFDLERGPMLRSQLVRLADDEWLLLLTMHHIASDGWSTGILIRELRELYAAFLEGRPARLPELPIQYADFAVWQRGWLRGEVLEEEVSHWRGVLAGAPPALDLPTDHPRPALQSFRGSHEALEIDPTVSRAFTGLLSRQGTTLFMGALAALQVLLARYSGARDFNVGTPISGRNRLEIEGLIGFFVNTLVLRADLSGEPGFAEVLGRVRARVLDAYTHQDVPFELLVDDLAPQRDLSRSPLFQVLLLVQDNPLPALDLPGMTLAAVPVESHTAKFDLTLNVVETDRGLLAGLDYAADLFEPSTARRLLRHFAALLGAVAADPGRPVGSLPLLAPAERQQLLAEWNDNGGGRREPAWLHERFEAQVRRTPEATALIWGESRLSFQELNRRANQLAHHLRRLGVGPESRVGISLERTPEMIVSLLAVLKAGGAYVPLDPTYPAQRLAWILEDARIEVLLTRSPLRDRLPGFGGWAFCFDLDSHLLAGEPEADPAGWRFERQLAYVLYTSGSTGRPKGVLLEHRSAVAMLDWAAERFAPEEIAGVLASTSINFDVSVFEIFCPLLHGGTMILAENALALPDLPAAGEVTLVAAVPSAVAELVRSHGIPPSAHVINLGGEPVPRTLADDLNRIPTIRKVYNLYGPTEDTTYSTWALLGPGETGAPSIGRPIAGSRLYVVDPLFQPVPLGAVGEIVLGGDGLSRGYLGRPELTAARFVPDPLGAEPGGRLYRTSDLGKFLPDGRVAYLGRIDHQVKVRGFRVELGEIEGVLREHPEVEDVVVVARESAAGARLLAYVVLRGGGPDSPAPPAPPETVERLRQHVAERLPVYMVPAAFVLLEALPHTPNGKVDRAALPEPGLAARAAGYVPPRTPAEELIAGVWAEVLGLPRVGAEDNFFELGGHSLLATRVMVRLRDAFGMDLPLRRLFEAPTVSGLALQVGSAWTEGAPAPPLHRRAEAEPRLSFAQERLWFLEQLQPESAAYNMPAALRLEGVPRVEALREALSEIVRRHEVLRTTFAQRGGEPVQVVHPAAPLPLPLVDLSALPAGTRGETARRLVAEESRRPFDLAAGPVIRASLLRLDTGEHVLLVTLHHVVSDGWSLGLLVNETSTLYQAFLEGRPSPLPELAVQYGDFAVWQREWLRGEVLESQLAWWREQLAGVPAVLDLPADRPRPAVRSSRGGRVPVEIPARVARELAALGRARGVTPFMLYLAAFQALLGRLAGREDLVVGTPIAGRVRAELEPLIGLFLNTLALRGNLWGDPGFGEQLARVREAALGAYAHQDLPFERLVEELAPERNLTQSPVFQVLFVFQNTPQGVLELPGLTWSPLDSGAGAAKFDLTLNLSEYGDGLAGQLGFHRDLFDEATVRRWAGHLGVLLEGIAREPEKRLSERELMSASERHQVVLAWNDTGRGVVEETLHGLFAAQARRAPEAPALRFEGAEMSFGELDRRSNQLARFLGDHGVGPDVLVGLCMERSLELMVGVLGILKAGGGYVPLDPGYPADRLAYMMEDSRAPVMLGQERLLDRMPESEAFRVLVDGDWDRIAAYSDAPLPELAETDNLACVLYTSGSTGRPKGVMDSHRCVINQLRWLQSTYRLDGTDRVLQKTPISWDVSQWELFWPLMSGACMVLAVPGGHQDPRYLASTISREKITTVHFVPSMLRIFLESESGESCASLRRVVSSGEALGLDLEEKFFASFTVDLNNMYGPGESARTTLWRCERENTKAIAPIGRPTHDTQVYILDRRMEPVPIGVTGEIWVASQSMARGYHLRPDLTAEKFLPNPFGAPGTRLYRTGDLGRTLPDGVREFLGRIDHQVKIRGVRIELGEIETALGQHPKVSDAVVMARAAGGGEKRLAAYVVPEDGPDTVTAEELREYLRAQLPDYMVPESWTMLEAMPLAPNGKADREKLPEPQWVAWQRDYVAPRTPVEELLAGVWAELLGVERAGARDSFFELGGNSLLATQVASRVRSMFSVELPLRTVFERPTPAELGVVVEELLRRGHGPAAPPLVPVPRTGPLPLSFAQQRLWFLHKLDAASPAYNLGLPLRLRGPLDAAALSRALDELVRRQESLRTVFEVRDRQVLQRIEEARPVPLPLADLTALPADRREEEAWRLARAEASRPFDLERGPVLRTLLIRLGGDDHAFVLTQHHIVSDGWSMGVFIREMTALYQAFSQGQPSPLPELPLQYADFAAWQRAWLSGEVLEGEVRWWKERLQGAPAVLELPLDRPRPPLQTFSGGHVGRELPAALAARLAELARREGATPFMALLALFEALLLRHTGQDDFVLGTPIANRNRSETEGLIGFFVNTLALRADLTGSPSFRRLLARVREATLGAYTHQDLPFEKLVEELRPERSLSHTPLFQVMFSLAMPAAPPSLPGLAFEALPVDSGTSKFDLTLVAEERDGRLSLGASYNSDLFLAATVRRLLEHFEVLLEGAVEDPERPVTRLPLMSAAEAHQVVEGWNATAVPFPDSSCLHELIAEQVLRSPEAVALEYGEERLTYAELHRRAGRLARRLRGLGIGTDSLVGICAERSIEMVVGLLGILRAGGAYVPLDPSYPADRLAYMLEDSGIGVLLTQSRLEAGLPVLPGTVLRLDDPAMFEGAGEEDLDSAAAPESLAYAIYTSGSTGRPKGAGVPHRGIVNRLSWMQSAYRLTPEDRVLQKTPFSFDVSVWEFFWPLMTGARLVMAPPGAHQDPTRLAGLIRDHGITTLHFVPSMLQVFLEAQGVAETCRSVRQVFASGEALPFDLKERFLARLPGTALHNLYGPTEASVDVTFHACSPGGERRIVPIGRPIDNTSILLLDPEGQPVPVGVPGELHIGGVNLARGYLGRPELTAERFVPDAFGEQPGARLYRTGDLARFRPDGEVEFLGRLDHQIKLHGVRIELGEIEAALGSHRGVRETVVMARQEGGDTRLVAYLVPQGEIAPDVAELRAFLRERLPEAMIPAAFVVLPAFPLNPSGKVDRKALPAPEWSERRAAFVAPETPAERALAALWAEILGLPEIGAGDSFFELGGTSLQAAILTLSLESRLGASVPLSALFEAPTVAGLARYLEARYPEASVLRDAGEDSPLVAIQPNGSQPPLFCVHPVGGTVFCYLPLARALGPDQPVYGLQSPGLSGGREPLGSVEEMAGVYLEALRSAQPHGPYRLAGWSMGGAVAYEMARRLTLEGEEVAALLLLDSSVPSESRLPGESDAFLAFAADLAGLAGRSLDLDPAELREMAPERRVPFLVEQAAAAGVLPPGVGAPQLDRLFQVFRANLHAQRSWTPRPASLDEVVLARPEAKLVAGAGDGGWSGLIEREITLWPVEGDHFSLLREPAVAGLARRIADHLTNIKETFFQKVTR
jgi:amino acid adenylation domain-containing protein